MELPTPFGNYQLLERIAVGGMAEVFLAKSFGVEGFEKRVVIKRILPGLARSSRFVSMFVKEAKISALLSHPNVVQVYELGRVGSDYYIAMEYIHGRDLTRAVRSLRARGERFPLNLAVHVAASIARGLGYAHSRVGPDGRPLNIVHRDVSPHNVLLSFQGEVKLVDFGIARLAGGVEDGEVTGRPGGGKYAYMSPEQASGRPIDGRSDLFSCGIVLYELLVNHRLFQHDDPAEKLRRVREAVVPDPREENPEVPERLWEVLQRALARDPEERFQSGVELEEELRATLYREGLRADDAMLGEFVTGLFIEELGPDPGARDLERMVRSLVRMDGPADSSAPSLDPGDDTGPSLEVTGSTTGALSMPQGPVVEKKPVAVVVAEVVGLTEFSQIQEPEALVKQHKQLERAVRRVVDRYGGWYDRFDDDTFTVIFGLPRTREDDHYRAVACARDLSRLADALRRRGIQAELAVGAHRGELAVSGSLDALRYVPRGDAVKLARRLAGVAEPGEVLVSDRLASHCGDRWIFRAGTPLRLKGHRTEQPCFVLDRRRSRAAGGMLGRWVRRGDEMERVAAALQRLAGGEGGFILIRGAVGTGKSRIIRELRGLARRARVPFFVGRAYPYGVDGSLTVFRELVAAALGLENTTDAAKVRSRLGRLVEFQLGEADAETIRRLFAADGRGRSKPPSREAVLAAAVSLVRGLAHDRPVVLVLEDMHYLGARDRQDLGHVMRATADEPVLWLYTSRRGAERGLPQPGQSIRLGPLDSQGQARLIRELLGVEQVCDSLIELVGRTAEGNPLYVGEIVKVLQQSGALSVCEKRAELDAGMADPGLPPTLEALIASRVDALDSSGKSLLQLGATIGLSFPPRLLARAAGADDVTQTLCELQAQSLVVQDSEDDDAPWSFSSHLVWEVVRGGTLGAQSRDLHNRVAEGIEALYGDALEPHLAALSHHCARAGRFLDAARYALRAGERHQEGAFLDVALKDYQAGLGYLEQVREDDSGALEQGEAILNLKAGQVSQLLGQLREAERHLQVALDAGEDLAMIDVELGCFLELGKLYQRQGRDSLAQANLEQGRAQAEIIGDAERQVEFLEALGHLFQDRGDNDLSQSCHARALRLAGENPQLEARALVGLAVRSIQRCDEEEALSMLRRAGELAERAGDRILAGRVANNLGALHYSVGRYQESLRAFRHALELRQGTGYRPGMVINLSNIGSTYLRLGDSARAFVAFEQARDHAREVGLERGVALSEMYLGYLDAERGVAGALERMRAAQRACARLGDRETALTGEWLAGRLLLRQGKREEGRQVLEAALAAARTRESTWLVRDLEAELARDDLAG